MAQKLNGRLNLTKIPKELIQTANNGDKFIYVDIVPNKGRECDINIALSNALGFGGHNASILFKTYI